MARGGASDCAVGAGSLAQWGGEGVPNECVCAALQESDNSMSTTQEVVLWFIGALALIALAGPAPNIATMIIVVIIAGLVLAHWSDTYSKYLPLPDSITSATGGMKS